MKYNYTNNSQDIMQFSIMLIILHILVNMTLGLNLNDTGLESLAYRIIGILPKIDAVVIVIVGKELFDNLVCYNLKLRTRGRLGS